MVAARVTLISILCLIGGGLSAGVISARAPDTRFADLEAGQSTSAVMPEKHRLFIEGAGESAAIRPGDRKGAHERTRIAAAAQGADAPDVSMASGVARDCDRLISTPAAVSEARVARVTLAGVPALLRMPPRVTQPPILLWHGFGPPAGEEELMHVLPLDEVPAVKVYLGLPLFGARQLAGGLQELAARQREDVVLNVFEPVVMGAAEELPAVVKALTEGRCMRPEDSVALVGFSAGGASVLIALAERQVPIDAAVTLNASTGVSDSVNAYERATGASYEWSERSRALASRSDAAKRSAAIARDTPAILLIHGQDDAMLTPESARKLHDVLRPYYAQAGAESRLRLSVVPGLQHSVALPDVAPLLNRHVTEWLAAREH
jgi:predicted esterase